jgi:predicted amino acid-binding ACT domain protein
VAAPFGDGDACVVVRPFAPVTREHALAHGRRYVLVVTGDDRPGILKTTTGALAARGINIEDWTYHVEGPRVTYIGVLTVPDGVRVADVQRALHRALDPMGLQCRMQHENIFRATNEVGPIKALMQEADNAARP